MDSTKNLNLNNLALEITSTLRQYYLDEDGLLIQGFAEGKLIRNRIIDDFGDVAPFLALYDGEDICKSHLDHLSIKKPYKDFNKAFEFTDLLLGLVWYSRVGKYKELALNLAEEISSYVEKEWFYGSNIYSTKKRGVLLPVSNGIDSTFIEVWAELYRSTKREKYLTLARAVAFQYREIRAKSIHQLVPKNSLNISFFIKKRSSYISGKKYKAMKDNTNYCFGLLDLIRITNSSDYKNDIREITNSLEKLFDSGVFLNNLFLPIQPRNKIYELTPSFAVIDYCCDAYKLLGEELYLSFAKKVADVWLEQQNEFTGLMPMYSNGLETYLDCETDMSVALTKLYECTDDSKYLNSSDRILEGIINFHKSEKGYVLVVDMNTGLVLSDSIKTKFVSLLAKLYYLKSSDCKIYDDQSLFMLTKDR